MPGGHVLLSVARAIVTQFDRIKQRVVQRAIAHYIGATDAGVQVAGEAEPRLLDTPCFALQVMVIMSASIQFSSFDQSLAFETELSE